MAEQKGTGEACLPASRRKGIVWWTTQQQVRHWSFVVEGLTEDISDYAPIRTDIHV